MKERWYDLRKLNKTMRKYCYRNKALIKKINYMDTDGNTFLEDKKVIWCKDRKNEHEGWCSCNLQIVCPLVINYRSDMKPEPAGTCNRECHDDKMREAIEAFVTLNPNIY